MREVAVTETNGCEYGPLLSLLHDGELPAERSREVLEHVRTCPACAAELEALRRMSGVFSTASLPPAPPSLKRLMPRAVRPRRWGLRMGPQPPPEDEALVEESFREPRHLRILRVLTAIAAVVFLVALGGLVLQQMRRPPVKATPGGPRWQQIETDRPETLPAHPEPATYDTKDAKKPATE
jgi:anti-sigma factor RsiW